jgi:preprotein translocase subunit SecG
VCVFLIIIVLLQSGKDADLAGAFGGHGSQSTFGPRGTATLLSKITTTLAVLFMVTSLSLWLIAAKKSEDKSTVVASTVKVTVRDIDTRAPIAGAKAILTYVKPDSLEDEKVYSEAFTDRMGLAEIELYDEGIEKFISIDLVEAEGFKNFQQKDLDYKKEYAFFMVKAPKEEKKEGVDKTKAEKTIDKKEAESK